MSLADELETAIRGAGVPITSVSIGNDGDRSTWLVEPAGLQGQAQPVIDAFVPATPNTLFDQFAEKQLAEKALKATAEALWECIPNPLMTKQQLRARAKQIFKNGNGA